MSNHLETDMDQSKIDITAIPSRRTLLQALIAMPALAWQTSIADILKTQPSANAVSAFDLSAVRLLAGPFKTAQQIDAKYMLSLEPDRLLHNFRVNAGLEPKAPIYGGWESQEPWIEIRCHGHTLGHYLSACAMMAAATDDAVFANRCEYIVGELAACQQARKDGLICAFPDNGLQLENSLSGKPIIGVPWYTTHKVMAGLRDTYTYTNNKQALQVLQRLADWIVASSSKVDDEQFEKMLGVEHGGMNEVLADLYVITGNHAYLELSEKFCHRALLDPLSAGNDTLNGRHSNTQIPKVIGFSRLAEVTGKPKYGNASRFFWHTVVEQRSFATGGNGDGEHFFPTNEFRQHLNSGKTMETCCTHNMLRLTRALFLQSPATQFTDYYERALFNGILASQDPDSGMMTYFQSTRPGYLKLYCTPTDSFWCCTGTGMENHAKYGEFIYAHDHDSLYVNLFIASELNWKEKQLRVVQQTQFPDQASTQLTIHTAAALKHKIKIRKPMWCDQMTIKVNGHPAKASTSMDGYVALERTWRNNDVITVDFPMRLHLQALPQNNDIAAIMYGPIVMAARLGHEGITPGADIVVNERTIGSVLEHPMDLPQLDAKQETLDAKVKRTAGAALSFKVNTASPDHELELIPFHRIAHERYTLYWKLV